MRLVKLRAPGHALGLWNEMEELVHKGEGAAQFFFSHPSPGYKVQPR